MISISRILTLTGLFLLSFCGFSQKKDAVSCRFTAGYYGETVTHNGLVIGIEHDLFQSEKYRILLATNLGGYVHPRNNTSLFLREQWGQRITFKSGLFIDQFLGLGYLHHFTHGGDRYEVLDNGAVVKDPNSGRSMIMPSFAIGTGYDLSKKSSCKTVFYLRPELFWKAPFNGYYLTHFALNAGVIFKLKGHHEE